MSFFSAYENELGIIVFERKAIALNYLKTWFIFDLLSWFFKKFKYLIFNLVFQAIYL